jgi:DNA repair protein RadC
MKHIIAEIKISYKPNKLGKGIKITDSNKAYHVLLDNWNKDTLNLYEEFKVLLMNNSNEVLGIHTLSSGGITGTLVDIRILYSILLKSCSTSFITVHNHPSGKLKPSQADISIYNKIKDAAKLFDINYLDNLILTESGKYSFMDEGY